MQAEELSQAIQHEQKTMLETFGTYTLYDKVHELVNVSRWDNWRTPDYDTFMEACELATGKNEDYDELMGQYFSAVFEEIPEFLSEERLLEVPKKWPNLYALIEERSGYNLDPQFLPQNEPT